MDVIHLPQDIFPGDDRIVIHHYANSGSVKGRSILHRNAFSLVISGEKTMHFAEKTIRVTDRDIHLLSAGNCVSTMQLSEKQVFRSVLIFFTNSVLSDFYVKYDKLVTKAKQSRKFLRAPFLAFAKDEFLLHYISSLELLLAQKEIPAEMKQVKFEELMLHLVEKHPAAIFSFRPNDNREEEELEIRRVMEANIANNLGMEELAFLCSISVSTFKRKFVRIYGMSPGRWMVQRKMELARDLLLHRRARPGEVYHQVGYENHSSFTKSFRQVYGVTPSEFRQNPNALH